VLKAAAALIEAKLNDSAVVVTYDLVEAQLSVYTGYLEGSVTFTNNARLIFFEFWRQTNTSLERDKYRYHLMDSQNQLVFCYDNAPHHPQIVTFPDHKHIPDGLLESAAPDFADVFEEAELHVLGIG
jgi:hypothetical protein